MYTLYRAVYLQSRGLVQLHDGEFSCFVSTLASPFSFCAQGGVNSRGGPQGPFLFLGGELDAHELAAEAPAIREPVEPAAFREVLGLVFRVVPDRHRADRLLAKVAAGLIV